MPKHLLRALLSLLPAVLVACAVPPDRPADRTPATPAAAAQARAEFTGAMGLALNGDVKSALPRLRAIDSRNLSPRQRTAVERVLATFDAGAPDPRRAGLDGWTAQVLDAYRTYWSTVLTGTPTADAAEKQLAAALARLVEGAATPGADMATLEPLIQAQIRARGYHSLHGVTAPLREFMLWRTQQDRTYAVTLPDGQESVAVVMLDDFVSLGWAAFATGDFFHTGGWATRERLYCVRSAYDLDSEAFKVSYLAHEGQHFSDYRRFPALEGPELEYRAKLVEIAYADTTLPVLLEAFEQGGSDSREHHHGHANRRVMRALAGALAGGDARPGWWRTVPPAAMRAAALRLFHEESRRLEQGR